MYRRNPRSLVLSLAGVSRLAPQTAGTREGTWAETHIPSAFELVGAARFERATFWSQTRRAPKLRYAPRVRW